MISRKGKTRLLNAIGRCVVFGLAALHSSSTGAAETVTLQAADFFYEDIRVPLTLAYEIVERAAECERNFARACGLPPNASGESIVRVHELLGMLSGAGLKAAVARKPEQSLDQAKLELAQLREKLLTALHQNERNLISKAVAVIQECPRENAQEVFQALPNLEQVDFIRFWNESEAEFQLTLETLSKHTLTTRMLIQRDWSPGRCEATYQLAYETLHQVQVKSRPYFAGNWREIPSSVRMGEAVRFLWELGYGFEAAIDPVIKEKVESYDRKRAH